MWSHVLFGKDAWGDEREKVQKRLWGPGFQTWHLHTPRAPRTPPRAAGSGINPLPLRPGSTHARFPSATSRATNCIYFLITNALLSPQRSVSPPLPSREQATGGPETAAGGAGRRAHGAGERRGAAAASARGGRQRRPSQAGAAQRPRRLPHAGKPHPAAPPDRGGVLGTPKESHLAPHPHGGVSARPFARPPPLAPSGRGGPPSRLRAGFPLQLCLGRSSLGWGRRKLWVGSGAGPGLRSGSLRGGRASRVKPLGPGHRPAPAVAAPAPARRRSAHE